MLQRNTWTKVRRRRDSDYMGSHLFRFSEGREGGGAEIRVFDTIQFSTLHGKNRENKTVRVELSIKVLKY